AGEGKHSVLKDRSPNDEQTDQSSLAGKRSYWPNRTICPVFRPFFADNKNYRADDASVPAMTPGSNRQYARGLTQDASVTYTAISSSARRFRFSVGSKEQAMAVGRFTTQESERHRAPRLPNDSGPVVSLFVLSWR